MNQETYVCVGSASGATDLISKINQDRLVRTLSDLIAIPSINPFGGDATRQGHGELAAARYVEQRLSALGYSCIVTEFAPGRANVCCTAPRTDGGSRNAIMFAGHLDTVQVENYAAPFEPRLEAGRVYGRGACDMKAAIACYIELAEILAEAAVQLDGDLLIAGVADEEYQQKGAKALHDELPSIDLVVIGEPTELRICTAAKGLAAYTLTVEGHATHSSVPNAGKNAILRTGQLLSAFTHHVATLGENVHPLLGPGTINVGTIEGGLKPNIVPSCCQVGFSRRLLPNETPDSARSILMNDIKSVAGSEDDWHLSSEWWRVDPYENVDEEIIGAFREAARKAGITDLTITGFPASSDAAYFGAPVVIFGPGSLEQAHSLNEWVEVEEMVAATSAYLQFAVERLVSQGSRD